MKLLVVLSHPPFYWIRPLNPYTHPFFHQHPTVRTNSFICSSDFRVLRLTAIFGGSFLIICCILAADRKSASRSSTFSQCWAKCRHRISSLRCFHSELLVSSELYWSNSSSPYKKTECSSKWKCIYHGLCNLFVGVLHGMLFYWVISSRLYMFELFSFIFIRVLRPSLRPQNYVWCWRRYSSEHRFS